jgi:hypothetical protein
MEHPHLEVPMQVARNNKTIQNINIQNFQNSCEHFIENNLL